jgi:hypothetical protein
VLCNAAPIYCQAHHITAWQPPARGPTNIDNLALVCTHHHHQLHNTGQTLTRTGPNQWTTKPSEPDEHDLVA